MQKLRELWKRAKAALRPDDEGSAAVAVSAHAEEGEPVGDRPLVEPPLDVAEGPQELLLRVDLPGCGPQDTQVAASAGALAIYATPPPATSPGREQRPCAWYRRVAVPRAFELHRARAHVSRGVLEIRVPRAASATARQIPVRHRA